MTELRPLDAGFVELEDSDPHLSMGIGAVAVLSGTPPTRAEFAELVGAGVRGNTRLRERMRRAPLDLSTPVWEPDPAFDLAHHIRWVALPEPADDAALFEFIATELAARLDRDHPLWQCVVVERLAGDRWAVLIKAHHSVADGVSGVNLLSGLCDQGSEEPEPAAAQPPPDGPGLRGLIDQAVRLPVDVPRAVVHTVRGLIPVTMAMLRPTADSSLNGSIGQQRRYVVARASLPEIREIGKAFGATVNDVVLAVLAGSYRALLLGREEEPTRDMLRILVPVSTRSAEAMRVLDNRVSALLPYLPVHVADPVQRLAAVHDRMNRHKARGEAGAEGTLLTLTEWMPFAPLAWAVRTLARLPQHSVSAVATNVPGPRRELTMGGRRVLELLPVLPIAVRLRSGVAILSYGDRLTFGITGDYDTMPDIGAIAEGIDAEIRVLLAAARAR
ncbi:wax ester/triacylglycerol synthase family O-acyltransferase [Nocardia seriolae]|uniref:Diacylglycerol O-acyltransferase n=1 Tax=Nocardia seriolae TaxID=37332 RepID=A0A0B8NGU7_9NOCA|nr:wax ester/triacylglycerol synthase family O-acyltransferase [Nocardia seriolae]MTJ88075.1 wax ester/triacylglycerol synthase family O-acyltransferase [Nocardia seriolae]MTK42033.1 wax ester/triacylglycerol synthase family O-acyltransferase [Nocardia seriolae]OJF80281.1 acyltransferase [Nocardia seriolae]PSK29595.1 wax ester/triacylglycerol synthase family O-acyltransferase [Nocardia seriolae]QOW35773.1 wax ester/triacylglycerol synthase family O-acyltransferase [Nocardia seriolae]